MNPRNTMGDLKLTEIESRMVVARCWGEKRMKCYCLIGAEFQFRKMSRILEMNIANGCTTMWMYLMPLIYTLLNS